MSAYSREAGEDFQEADRRQTLRNPSIRGESEETSDEDGYEELRTSAHSRGCAGSEGASVVVYSAHYVKTIR